MPESAQNRNHRFQCGFCAHQFHQLPGEAAALPATRGKTQHFQRNCNVSQLKSILENPQVHVKTSAEADQTTCDSLLDTEDEVRQELLACEKELRAVQLRRDELLDEVGFFQAKSEQWTEKFMAERRQCQAEAKARIEAVAKEEQEKMQRAEQQQEEAAAKDEAKSSPREGFASSFFAGLL